MQTISLDSNNNIQLDNYGNIAIKTEAEALVQDIATTLSMCKGEDPYNIEDGINYDEEILGKMGNEDYIKGQFRNRILKNNEVLSIANLDIQFSNNQLQIISDINSIYGEVNL